MITKKKVLVTGAGGFIGSHLTEKLSALGYAVKAFVHYNSRNSWGWLDSAVCKERIELVAGDIRDADIVRHAMHDVEIVFHLAALIGIPYSYRSPEAYVDTNIRGTLNILEAARDFRVKKVIVTSTSEIYGTAQSVPIAETHPINPQSPYAATKAAADLLALSFYRSFSLPVAVVRPFNTYGPRQSARAVIPTIISQVLSGKKYVNLGSFHPTRDLVYVKDTVDGFVKILETHNTEGEVINIATQKEISIGDLAHKIIELCGSDAKIKPESIRKRPEKSEVERLLGSNEKIKRLTSWKQKYSIGEGLRETIAWFKNNLSRYKVDIYNV